MAALSESTVSGPVKPEGGRYGSMLPHFFTAQRKNKVLKRKKETVVLWPIIHFKLSMPSPNVKCKFRWPCILYVK